MYEINDDSATIQLATGHTTLAGADLSNDNFTFTHIPVGSPTITKSVVDSTNVTVNTMIIESDHVFSNLNTDYTVYTVPTQTDYSTLSGFPTLTITIRDPSVYATVVSDITVSSDQAVTPLPAIQDTTVFTSVPSIDTLRGDVTNFVVTHAEFIEAKDNYALDGLEPYQFNLILPAGHKIKSEYVDLISGIYTADEDDRFPNFNYEDTAALLDNVIFRNSNGFKLEKRSFDRYALKDSNGNAILLLPVNRSLTSNHWHYQGGSEYHDGAHTGLGKIFYKDFFEMNLSVMHEVTLPNDNNVAADIQDDMQGLYEVTLTQEYSDANPDATVESLGITDYSTGDSRIQFVNSNNYIIKKVSNEAYDYSWRLIHPDNTSILQINLSSLVLSLPGGHLVKEPYATEMEGEYIAEPSHHNDTLEDLGITDYTNATNQGIKFVNANGYKLETGGGGWWYLRHPDGGAIFKTHTSFNNHYLTEEFQYVNNNSTYHNGNNSQKIGSIFTSNLLTSPTWRYFNDNNIYHTASNAQLVSDSTSILGLNNKSQVKGHLNTFSFTHEAFTSVYTVGDEPFASTNNYFVVANSAHPKGTLEISGNPGILTGIKDSTISFDDGVYTDPEGIQQTISVNNITFKNADTNDNVNGSGTEPDGTIVDFSISFADGVTSLTVDSTVVADSEAKFRKNDDNNPLYGIAKSIKLGATNGNTDYIILPINPFSGNVDSQSQSFLYDSDTNTHFVYLHSTTTTPLLDTSKIKITPVGLISKFKDIYNENTGAVITDNISIK